MGRTLEGGDTPWDKGAAAPPLLDYLKRPDQVLKPGSRVLVPGCGSGNDVRGLASADLRVTGLDLSPTAVEHARSLPAVGGEDYLSGDFFDAAALAPLGFDSIWEHTCFCAIDPSDRPRYMQSAASILPSGGHLCGIFFLNPDVEPGEGPPFGVSPQQVIDLASPWFELRHQEVPASAFPGREGREWLAIFVRRPDSEVALTSRTV